MATFRRTQPKGLNAFYKRNDAMKLVEKLATTEHPTDNGLVAIHAAVADQLDIFEETDPTFYRIVERGDDREVVFSVVGAVTAMMAHLPNRALNNDDLRHKSQQITLTGFGAASFEAAVNNVRNLHWLLKRHTGTEVMDIPTSRFEDHTSLSFKCRFFTTGDDALRTKNVPPVPYVDRNGHIKHHTSDPEGRVRHGPENRVKYLRKMADSTCVPVSPGNISIGDIVEVRFSVLGVPTASGVRFILIHSRVTLLDNKLDMAAGQQQYMASLTSPNGVNPVTGAASHKVKRRYDSDDSDDEDGTGPTRRKLARMEVTNETELLNGSSVLPYN